MEIKLTYEEACKILRHELGQYLALNEITSDIEIEIEDECTPRWPRMTATEVELRNAAAKAERIKAEVDKAQEELGNATAAMLNKATDNTPREPERRMSEPTWTPDGKKPPPSREAFLAWAEGKRVHFSGHPSDRYNYYHSFSAHPSNLARVLCKDRYGSEDWWKWLDAEWQEYHD